ncbi:MAG: hypothetical protein AAGF12_14155 [Myxococcota bacterium]
MTFHAFSRHLLFAAAPLVVLALAGCGDDSSDPPADGDVNLDGGMNDGRMDAAGSDGGDTVDASGDADAGPSFPRGAIMCGWVFGPEGATSFIRFISDAELEGDAPIEVAAGAVETGGTMSCGFFGESVFVHSFETPTITRFDLTTDGELVEGETVSVMPFGISSLAGGFGRPDFVFEDRGYFADIASLQLAVWEPATMTLIQEISLAGIDATPRPGITLNRVRTTARGNDLLFSAEFFNEANISTAGATLARLRINPPSDEVVFGALDERCGNAFNRAQAANGDLYFGSGSQPALDHALGLSGAVAPCALRVLAGEDDFDPSYVADLNALTGGRPTTGPILLSGNRSLLQAFDTDARPIDPSVDTTVGLIQEPQWTFFEWELGSTDMATPVPELGRSTGVVSTLEFDGRTFLRALTVDGAILTDLSSETFETIVFAPANAPVGLHRVGDR